MALTPFRVLVVLLLTGVMACGGSEKGTPRAATLPSSRGALEAVCSVEPSTPGPTRLVYLGPSQVAVGESVGLAALLTDGSGVPLAGREVRLEWAGTESSATTDAWGLARATFLAGQAPGEVLVRATHAGDSSASPAQLASLVTVQPVDTRLVLQEVPVRGEYPPQPVRAWLTQWEGKPLAGKTVRFEVAGLQAEATTDSEGVAQTLLTLPEDVPESAVLKASFAGEEGHAAASAEAPLWHTPPELALLNASQTQPEWVLPGQDYAVEVFLANLYWLPVEAARVRETFHGTLPPEAEASVGSLDVGEWRTVTFTRTAPVIGTALQPGESTHTYQQRLAAQEGQRLLSVGEVGWSYTSGVQELPQVLYSASRLALPRLMLSLKGPSCVVPGQTVTYTLTVFNAGAASSASGTATVVLPGGSEVEVALHALTPGSTWSKDLAWTAPPLPARQEGETASEYAARLMALDGQVFMARGALSWKDSQDNTYGPLAQVSAATLKVEVPPPSGPPDAGSELPPDAGSDVPPDAGPPGEVAPPPPTLAALAFEDSVSFLYEGADPLQKGVAPDALKVRRLAVLRGKVFSRQGLPLAGVRISILRHPEYGYTHTREDGLFDLAVNGGGPLTVQYEAAGLLPSQRQVEVPWTDFTWLPEVVLVPLDSQGTPVDFSGATASLQVARGSPVTDTDGTRQATLLFPAGTQATAVLPDGQEVPLTSATVRATEYTVGEAGPASMPAQLPPTSGYTYAVELSLDEAQALGAHEVRFNQPVASYVENFVGFPVGGIVPAGYYDRRQGVWTPSDNGRILQVHSIVAGVARLDITGDGQPDSATALAALGITEAEQRQLASLYPVGRSLWRVPVTHFTPWDYNWPYAPPADAEVPENAPPEEGQPEEEPECTSGSVIECQNQSLGESLPLTGTSFRLHFQSDRVPGHKDRYTVRIPVSGDSIPGSLQGIVVEWSVAGRRFTRSLPAAPNQTLSFTWDGKDAYGRTVQSQVPVTGRTGYLYQLVYLQPDEFARAFGRTGFNPLPFYRQRTMTLWQSWQSKVGGWNESPGNLGGWRLSMHHQLDVHGGLFLGHGGRRSEQVRGGIISTVAGIGVCGFEGDGGPATQARICGTQGLAFGADGSLYFAAGNRVRRVAPDGIISTVAGAIESGFGGDGGPATLARLNSVQDVAVGPDGSLYIADGVNHRIRRVGPDGIISTVAGTGVSGFGGDGGPATLAQLDVPESVAMGPDGSLYIADTGNHRIRRLSPDGIISTVAGTGASGFGGDGGPATQARLHLPEGIAFGPDGSLYVADLYNHRIRRVGPDGRISTVAGTGGYDFGGDGGPATLAQLSSPRDVAVGPDGSLYISTNDRVRRVGPDGIISTVVGTGVAGFGGDGGPATLARLKVPWGISVGPDGGLYLADAANRRIRAVRRSQWIVSLDEVTVASEDGREVYVFGPGGRHLRTVDALTGALRYHFEYDPAGQLTSVTDGEGGVTRVERDGSGKPLAIVASQGQRTTLAVDAQGYLDSVTNPAGETVDLTHAPDGLLTAMKDARGGLHAYTYDALGKLERDTHPSGGYKHLTRTEAGDGYTVALSTALGVTTRYQVQQLPGGGQKRITTAPDGTATLRLLAGDGSTTTTTAPDGTVMTEVLGPDARFGMQVPLLSSLQVKLPSGLTSSLTHGNTASYYNGPLTLVDSFTLNGRTHTTTYRAATRTLTTQSPEGRLATATLDEKGRVVRQEVPGVLPVEYSYDAKGRLWKVTQGSRTQTSTYNAAGYLETLEDALQQQTHFTYDLAGRPTSLRLPGNRTVGLSFDAHGNLTKVVPPGQPAHSFIYTPTDATDSYTPPLPFASEALLPTQYAYDLDGALISTTLPDGSSLELPRDSAGRVDWMTTPRTTVDWEYDAQGRLSTLVDPAGASLAYTYDGPLVTRVVWTGGVEGSVGYTYTSDFTRGTLEVQGQSFTFGYDDDGLLTSAGALSLERRADNGLLSSTTLGQVKTGLQYTLHGEVEALSATVGAASLYSFSLGRDDAGRITSKTEVAQGVTHAWGYTYDEAGRLHTVTRDGVPYATYGYDANGNRTSLTHGSTLLSATYDAQDRLQTYGAASYTFGPNGDLQQRLRPPEAVPTRYHYDATGALTQVQLPDGTQVDYVLDATGRRVGKRLNGTRVQGFLHDGPLRIVAELDGTGAVVSRFIYASQAHVPDFLVKGGTTYRLLTDHLGSVRLVVDASTGAVVQALEYGPFGEVLADSNPGFQPFGFAGGLYDRHTGLTRFGARDYDAETGRWMNKDPIYFSGGDTNLYAYVENDPVNAIDPSGLLNPAKANAAVLTAANAGRLYVTGGAKIMAAAGAYSTGVGAPIGTGALLLASWNLKGAHTALKRSWKLWNEALDEDWSEASWRNLLAVLPYGDQYDDPCEPTMMEFFRKKKQDIESGVYDWMDALSELGTASG
jgi:RHS repeat-associated protein/uncharacterized repeat protein (TIGR01451 family)